MSRVTTKYMPLPSPEGRQHRHLRAQLPLLLHRRQHQLPLRRQELLQHRDLAQIRCLALRRGKETVIGDQ
jgi:hypothetical protein